MQELLDLYLDSPASCDLAYLYMMSILVDIRWDFRVLFKQKFPKSMPTFLIMQVFFYQALKKARHPQYKESLSLLRKNLIKSNNLFNTQKFQ